MPGPEPSLLGRQDECRRLSGLLAAAKAGRSSVLVLRGEAGIGKTALLEFLLARAVGCRTVRAAGVESEAELAFASLHQLCLPMLDRLDALPAAQRDALGAAFGLRAGGPPDRLLVGLAVLTLLSEAAGERPLVCVVDDAQWLDRASAQVLEFVARRLGAEPVALVLAARAADEPVLAGLPDLAVRGLGTRDAAALLDAATTGPLDRRVRDRILAESQGNPLALLELPRGLAAPELVFGGPAEESGPPVVQRLEQGFLRQVAVLPPAARRLLLVAAAEPVGDVRLLQRAAGLLDAGPSAVAAAEASGLVDLGERVRFRHPLVRSAVYRAAPPAERREAHRALAEATDPDRDPDRRAWHRARAAVGPDEDVATDLDRSAGRALAHGGVAAAAAFLELAAALTPDPARRVRRCLDAAQAKVHAGAFDAAAALVAAAQAGPLDEPARARIDLLRAQTSFAENRGNEALPLLLAAARRLEPLDPASARETYLDALSAALFAGRLAAGPGARQVAEAARAAPPRAAPTKGDALLDGLAVLFTDGYAAAVEPSRRAVRAFVAEDLSLEEGLRSSWLAASTAVSLWDDASWDALTRQHLEAVRAAGALSALPLALTSRVVPELFTGDVAAATALVEEIRAVTGATGGVGAVAPYGEVCVAAVRGDAQRAEQLIRDELEAVTARGEGVGVNMLQWARSVLANGLGHYAEAQAAAGRAAADSLELGPPKWALAELVEAAARSGDARAAGAALEQLSAMARAAGTDWALGIEASRRALLSSGGAADELHREAVERLDRTGMRLDLARARLLHGEWLRRAGRRADARDLLRSAHEALAAMGADGFADRARRELLATGETVRRRTVGAPAELTAQEAHIARRAAEGLTNVEIAAVLFLSPRTVEWHLRKVFEKLGIATRRQLRLSLPEPPGHRGAAGGAVAG